MRRRAASLALIALPFSAAAMPGAWTQEQGSALLITSALYYTTQSYFDDAGRKQSQKRYSKEELNPYGEYGLRDGLTLGGNVFIDRVDDSSHARTGIGDSEWFLRQRLWQNDTYVFSVQPLIKLPSLTPSKTPPVLGSSLVDAEFSALGGMQFSPFGQTHYAELDAGYRMRFGPPTDQLRFTATLGLRATPELTIMPQLFQVFRVGAGNPQFTESPRDNYTLTRFQLSAVYALDAEDAVQLGAFAHVAGRNAGDGGGVLLAYWRTF